MTITHSRVYLLRILLPVVLLLALLPCMRALAQGTFGTLPDPISTTELMSYADRLGLSPQQRQAVLTFHDQYKREFRVLREGEIADYLDEMRNADDGSMPQRKMVENLLKGMDRLNARIAAVDNRLLDQIQTILSEEQTAALPRVRLARERKRLTRQWVMMMAGGPGLDLSELFVDLDLIPDAMAAADPAMYQYETRLTSSLRDLRETTLKAIMELFDAMEEMGFNEQTMEDAQDDPEAAAEMMQAMQTVFMQIMQKAMDAAGEMKELNRQTFRTVYSLLPERPGRTFRNRFYTRVYPFANFAIRDFSAWRDIARKADDLTEEQRGEIGGITDQLQIQYDQVADRAARLMDEFESARSLTGYSTEEWQKLSETQTALQGESSDALETALNQIAEFAPDELVDELRRHAQRPWSEEPTPDEKDGEEAAEEPQDDAAWTGDMFIPARITRKEMSEYNRELDLSDAQRTIIWQLYDDYVVAFADLKSGPIQAVNDASVALWDYNSPSDQRKIPKTEDIAGVYDLRRAAQQAIRDLDGSFFDDVQVVLDSEKQTSRLARLRLARIRRCYEGAKPAYARYGVTNTPVVDLSDVVRREELSRVDLGPADSLLAQYEESLTDAMRQWYQRAMEYQQTQECWAVEYTRLQSEGEDNMFSWGQRYMDFIGPAQRNLNEAAEAIGDLNETTMDELVSVMDGRAAGSLRRAYAKVAYPTVYDDPMSVEEHLDRALDLDDLTSNQRRRLNEIAADYRPAYEESCRTLIELESAVPQWNPGDEEFDWQEQQDYQQKIETIRFDRDELSARAAAELAAVLTEEQLSRIGGLPKPPEQGGRWGF